MVSSQGLGMNRSLKMRQRSWRVSYRAETIANAVVKLRSKFLSKISRSLGSRMGTEMAGYLLETLLQIINYETLLPVGAPNVIFFL